MKSTTTTQTTIKFGTKGELPTKVSRKRKGAPAAPPLQKPAHSSFSSASSSSSSSSPHRFSAQVRSKSSPINQEEVQHVLKKVFGLKKLRNLQPQVVECALKRTSQLLVLATGGGKSLCYQLPACLLGGMTIVISPLIALMVDQVQSLKARNIPAACVCSSQTESENRAVLQQVADPTNNPLTLLYITPESIQTDRMRAILKQLYKESRLALFAVDEAHCLSR
jgi:superfamily II DNA helicase RecQ